jgi:hypothetical protein
MADVDVGSACARFHRFFVGGSDSKRAHAPRQVGKAWRLRSFTPLQAVT